MNTNTSYLSSTSNIFIERIVRVDLNRTTDWKEFQTISHLGDILKCGTYVIGYDLTLLNFSEDFENLKNAPDVVLIKKKYSETRSNKRIWKLRRMEKDGVMIEENY